MILAVTGLQSGVAGAFAGDTLSAVYGGTPVFTSTGSAASAPVGSGTYAIAGSNGTLTSLAVYNLAVVGGTLTVNPAALTITANNASKAFGQSLTFAGVEFGTSGLANGETVGSVMLASAGAADSAGVAGSPNAITASGATGGTFNPANYAIRYVDGALTVVPANIRVATLASDVVRDSFYPVVLPDQARPVIDAPNVTIGSATGVFYADPRFSRIFVCFGSSCFTAGTYRG